MVVAAYDVVDGEGDDGHEGVAEDDALDVVEDEVAAGDDADVDHEEDFADAHVFVFVDDGGDDVGAACGASGGEA